ncbi:hypothetical protein RON44_08935 [Lactobacillus gasseri]|jgi:hypothetical protein|uniref:Uncharacterized protein n=2 Tax=Lactobacillaceae TaxID=33958 RepID=A0ABY3BBB3_LACGS|nr:MULTISPECIES: hypothetical protein [Lactobacillaceae]MCZ3760059.1 hypothetical protein [Lactobacillus gasseri]MCZ3761789.1 hypothetical protein [Lactobacillus gasseri]MCZ3766218.1 hypothetical protein [Lactobacillus gasseri]MCZ3767044.1 hypothetical protein [Lactobacillus gasseri]MCZ3770552.1 hypothetical protein [Lactobacillus gasseri]
MNNENIENYKRLREDFDFQKSMAILILTAQDTKNNQVTSIIQNAVYEIRKNYEKDWVRRVRQMIKLICIDPELKIMF